MIKMIQVWSLNKSVAGLPIELGMFTKKEDAVRMQQGYNSMYHEELHLEERIVYESIFEIDVSGV